MRECGWRSPHGLPSRSSSWRTRSAGFRSRSASPTSHRWADGRGGPARAGADRPAGKQRRRREPIRRAADLVGRTLGLTGSHSCRGRGALVAARVSEIRMPTTASASAAPLMPKADAPLHPRNTRTMNSTTAPAADQVDRMIPCHALIASSLVVGGSNVALPITGDRCWSISQLMITPSLGDSRQSARPSE
jgi:hypothetical protein